MATANYPMQIHFTVQSHYLFIQPCIRSSAPTILLRPEKSELIRKASLVFLASSSIPGHVSSPLSMATVVHSDCTNAAFTRGHQLTDCRLNSGTRFSLLYFVPPLSINLSSSLPPPYTCHTVHLPALRTTAVFIDHLIIVGLQKTTFDPIRPHWNGLGWTRYCHPIFRGL